MVHNMNAICYPHPDCPDKEQCARYDPKGIYKWLATPMNAMPYRVEGEPCKWFVDKGNDDEV